MTTTNEEPLICFGDQGHLTEPALVMLADGEPLPPATEAHLGGCEECTARLVQLSVASVLAGEQLRAMAPRYVQAPAPERPLASLPWRAVASALGVSFVSLAPALARMPAFAVRAVPALAHAGPVLTKSLVVALSTHGQGAFVATFASSVLLIVVGATVSRWSHSSGVTS